MVKLTVQRTLILSVLCSLLLAPGILAASRTRARFGGLGVASSERDAEGLDIELPEVAKDCYASSEMAAISCFVETEEKNIYGVENGHSRRPNSIGFSPSEAP